MEYRLLRKISGPKRDEVTGEWKRLHKEMGEACGTYARQRTFI